MVSDLLLLLPVAVVLLLLLVWRLVRTRGSQIPANAVVVDGSNVMHWGGDASVKVLQRVILALEAQGLAPIVFFDANVGYKLSGRYYGEAVLAGLLGLPRSRICVADKGVVADEWILAFATEHNLRVVTNDKFRDWRQRFPKAATKGFLIGGTWKQGNVVFLGKLPVPA